MHCEGHSLIDSYQQECRLVRKALDGDLVKVSPRPRNFRFLVFQALSVSHR